MEHHLLDSTISTTFTNCNIAVFHLLPSYENYWIVSLFIATAPFATTFSLLLPLQAHFEREKIRFSILHKKRRTLLFKSLKFSSKLSYEDDFAGPVFSVVNRGGKWVKWVKVG